MIKTSKRPEHRRTMLKRAESARVWHDHRYIPRSKYMPHIGKKEIGRYATA